MPGAEFSPPANRESHINSQPSPSASETHKWLRSLSEPQPHSSLTTSHDSQNASNEIPVSHQFWPASGRSPPSPEQQRQDSPQSISKLFERFLSSPFEPYMTETGGLDFSFDNPLYGHDSAYLEGQAHYSQQNFPRSQSLSGHATPGGPIEEGGDRGGGRREIAVAYGGGGKQPTELLVCGFIRSPYSLRLIVAPR